MSELKRDRLLRLSRKYPSVAQAASWWEGLSFGDRKGVIDWITLIPVILALMDALQGCFAKSTDGYQFVTRRPLFSFRSMRIRTWAEDELASAVAHQHADKMAADLDRGLRSIDNTLFLQVWTEAKVAATFGDISHVL